MVRWTTATVSVRRNTISTLFDAVIYTDVTVNTSYVTPSVSILEITISIKSYAALFNVNCS